jgi:hypothetical protein
LTDIVGALCCASVHHQCVLVCQNHPRYHSCDCRLSTCSGEQQDDKYSHVLGMHGSRLILTRTKEGHGQSRCRHPTPHACGRTCTSASENCRTHLMGPPWYAKVRDRSRPASPPLQAARPIYDTVVTSADMSIRAVRVRQSQQAPNREGGCTERIPRRTMRSQRVPADEALILCSFTGH